MLIRSIREDEKHLHNRVVGHPLQTWEWGDFRKTTGTKVERVGCFKDGVIQHALQVTFHRLPILDKTVGYFPKGFLPNENQIAALKQLAEKHNALFIKLEPNVPSPVGESADNQIIKKFLAENDCVPGRPLFTKYSFILDLTPDEETLFSNLQSKTRYNIRLASKKGVQIFENSTAEGMEEYVKILEETTKRQGFYAHSPEYFRKMWQSLSPTGMIRIFQAIYQGEILASWIMFVHNQTLYYPYGASRSIHREVMASNLMMWEMIRFGKAMGCTSFDMWGSLGPDPDPKDPWYGFHRFKQGYNGVLVEFIGSYDLVVNQPLYQIFRIAENLRWTILKIAARFRK
ncbi:MAG: lipid II:glycine glycyltransferase FemX [Patescibacteria group bacterium]